MEILPKDLMNNVLGKIYDVIVNGDGTTIPKSNDNFFSWTTPGIPFDVEDFEYLKQGFTGVYKPRVIKNADGTESIEELTEEQRQEELAKNTNKMYVQAEQLSRFVDFIPDASGINDGQARFNINNIEGTLSDVYEEVLRFSQVAKTELSDADKSKIERFRQLLQVERDKEDILTGEIVKVLEPSPLVKAYNDKMQAWVEAALEYNNARIDALTASTPRSVHNWAINEKVLRPKVRLAMNDWINNGFKNEFEGIAARIDQMSARDLSLLKASYVDAFEKAKVTGLASNSEFLFTSLAPANFATSKGWTRFTFTNKDYNYYSQKTTSGGGGATGFSLGIFSIGGTGSSEKSELNINMDFSSFELSFEICQIPLIKPWLKMNFLTSKTWRFSQDNVDLKTKFLSDGKLPPSRDSMMAAIPTSMIMIRNLALKFANSNSVVKELDKKISGGGLVGIGPFFLGGNYATSTSNKSRNYHIDSQGIYVDGMQCIGFKCFLLPKSPNPDPSISSWV